MTYTRYGGGALQLLRTMSFVPVLESIKLIQTLVTRLLLALGQGEEYTSSINTPIDTLG